MKCCLCGKKIPVVRGWKYGNNAEPVKTGRCCDLCNETKVIPLQILRSQTERR
jgi:hypothetical protein